MHVQMRAKCGKPLNSFANGVRLKTPPRKLTHRSSGALCDATSVAVKYFWVMERAVGCAIGLKPRRSKYAECA